VKAEWEATMIPTNCRTERAPLAAKRRAQGMIAEKWILGMSAMVALRSLQVES